MFLLSLYQMLCADRAAYWLSLLPLSHLKIFLFPPSFQIYCLSYSPSFLLDHLTLFDNGRSWRIFLSEVPEGRALPSKNIEVILQRGGGGGIKIYVILSLLASSRITRSMTRVVPKLVDLAGVLSNARLRNSAFG